MGDNEGGQEGDQNGHRNSKHDVPFPHARRLYDAQKMEPDNEESHGKYSKIFVLCSKEKEEAFERLSDRKWESNI